MRNALKFFLVLPVAVILMLPVAILAGISLAVDSIDAHNRDGGLPCR